MHDAMSYRLTAFAADRRRVVEAHLSFWTPRRRLYDNLIDGSADKLCGKDEQSEWSFFYFQVKFCWLLFWLNLCRNAILFYVQNAQTEFPAPKSVTLRRRVPERRTHQTRMWIECHEAIQENQRQAGPGWSERGQTKFLEIWKFNRNHTPISHALIFPLNLKFGQFKKILVFLFSDLPGPTCMWCWGKYIKTPHL